MPLITELELRQDFVNGADAVFDAYERLVQSHPAMPVDTGALRDGVVVTEEVVAWPRATAVITSTARSEEGEDYGLILDRSKGQRIEPKRYQGGSDAGFGPRALSDGDEFGPVRSAQLTTKHVGWWDKVNAPALWDQATAVLGRFNL